MTEIEKARIHYEESECPIPVEDYIKILEMIATLHRGDAGAIVYSMADVVQQSRQEFIFTGDVDGVVRGIKSALADALSE